MILSLARPGIGGESRRLGMTRPDGHFEVNIPRASLEPEAARPDTPFEPALVAVASELGPDWAKIDPAKSSEPITLKLRRDDVPIEGRIISLEGRPIAGASVKIAHLVELPPAVINKLRANDGKMNPAPWGEMRRVMIVGEAGAIRPTRTGADGRFRITGVGRDRLALLVVEGESIEQSFAMVSTSADHDGKPIILPADGSPIRKIEAPRFEMAVAPGRAIQGTVRDRDTNEPIAGARVRNGFGGNVTTDHQGGFRIAGRAKGGENVLEATLEGQPYIKVARTWNDQTGLQPLKLDLALKRGVWVEGKVTDASSGKPVKAIVMYYPFRDNPNVKECPDASFLNNYLSDEVEFATDASGRFRAVALPGGGILAVRVTEPGYVTAKSLDAKVARNVVHPGDFQYYMSPYHALVPIDAPAGKTLVVPDITVAAGRTQHITIVGPDGRPVSGARILCLQVALQKMSLTGETISGSEWSFIHANPGKAEAVIISHVDRSLGTTIDLKGDEPDPIRIVLQPTATVTGRLVGEDGQPRPGMQLAIGQRFKSGGRRTGTERSDSIRTGPDGRFRIKTLVPGLTYHVAVIKKQFVRNYSLRTEGYLHKNEWTIKPGETVDWGDVQVEPYPQ